MKKELPPSFRYPVHSNPKIWRKCMALGDRYRERFANDPSIKVRSFFITAKRYGFRVIDGGRHD